MSTGSLVRHLSVAISGLTILLALPSSSRAQVPASDRIGPATFVVMLRGARVGTETVSLNKTGNGWLLSGSSRLAAPFDVTVSRFDVSYGTDWQPARLTLQGSMHGEQLGISTTFGLTTAMNDVTRGDQRGSASHQISSRTVVLPSPFFGAYEAMAARLHAAELGTRIPVYVAPDGETSVTVEGVTPRRVSIGDVTLDLRIFALSMSGAGTSSHIDVWVDTRGRLARLEMPAVSVVVIRDDLASVMAREERVRNPGDGDVFVPANGFSLGATITLPADLSDDDDERPTIVLVAGSGPQDRDYSSYGVSVFGQLAGRLAEAGFVVLRYDARGIGRSGGRTENATIDEYADDVVRVVNWLRRRDDVDNDRIAVVGYGDAGPVALRAAAREDRIKGVALLAAPGRSGREVIIEQQQLMLGRIGIPEAEQAMRQALQYRIIDAAISGEGWETIPPELRVQAETPWFRSWLLFEPAEAFRRMDQPVLIVHGELDAEVPVAHADALETLSRQRDRGRIAERYTRLVALPSVNHLLVPSDRGDVEEYETLETLQIAPEVPEAIATWMNDLLPRR